MTFTRTKLIYNFILTNEKQKIFLKIFNSFNLHALYFIIIYFMKHIMCKFCVILFYMLSFLFIKLKHKLNALINFIKNTSHLSTQAFI